MHTRNINCCVLSIVIHCSPQHEGIEVTLTQNPQPKPDSSKLVFGKTFSDHMLTVDWTIDEGWAVPKIGPFANFSLSPALSALHYGVEVCVCVYACVRACMHVCV